MEISTALRKASWASASGACFLGEANDEDGENRLEVSALEDVMEAGGETMCHEGSEGEESLPLAT
jgi:hypothetical protein